MWRADLEPLDPECAFATLADLRDSETFRPAWATFHQRYQERRRMQHMAGGRALPTGAPTAPTRVLLHRLADISAATADRHDHRQGHLSCPVCKLHDHDEHGRHTANCDRCKLLGTALTP